MTRAELADLGGRPLVCWCAPLPCHGHVLLAAAAWPRLSPTSAWRPLGGRANPSSASAGTRRDPEQERYDSPGPRHQTQYLEEELALIAATHQYVLDGPSPTKPADRAPSSTACGPLDQHTRLPEKTH